MAIGGAGLERCQIDEVPTHGRIVTRLPSGAMSHKVAIVMGSGTDRPVMEKAGEMLEQFGVGHVTRVLSAHKTPDEAIEFAATAADQGFEVIIAGAGKAAHLAGVMAAKSLLPVIGVPLSASLEGMDALLSTVQMPTGIPVATVAIDGATNAALLAVAILAVGDPGLRDKLAEYRQDLAAKTLAG
jgi:5-(carboxyamino)imidazole ribonucleotide mutase